MPNAATIVEDTAMSVIELRSSVTRDLLLPVFRSKMQAVGRSEDQLSKHIMTAVYRSVAQVNKAEGKLHFISADNNSPHLIF